MPLLYPIAFLSFVVIYFLEMFALFKIYKKPIDYDVELHGNVLYYLQYGAFISLGFSFWQLSNPQLLMYIDGDHQDLVSKSLFFEDVSES